MKKRDRFFGLAQHCRSLRATPLSTGWIGAAASRCPDRSTAGDRFCRAKTPFVRRHAVNLRVALAFALITSAVVVLAGSTASVAQLPFPNPFGNARDVAVRAALSEFGKTVGDQLPIVLSPSDAFPTAELPGLPFVPRAAPNITASLRASTDGTVELPPGDYAFTVDVFCMKAHAGSPSAHRYLVAPLHGSAADIFRALNSRAPSYHLDHHALQVLSWDVQAGLAYSSMRPAQRAIVDRVIPDFRSRLEGDVYTRIRGQYDQVAAKVPGMPSFDDALSRIGPTGQAVLELQTLREQMAQPPPTFEELARELIPIIPLEPGGSGPTPWSRYSDRVYVRFVTAGNYATPGTYQVRVLPAQLVGSIQLLGLGSPGGGAPVPFSNIVNNPGTPSVQPLTQGPQPGGSGHNPAPSPSPTPTATITSQTFATVPAARSRLTVGVGEPVKLTFSGADANWTMSGGEGKLDSTTGKVVDYTASITRATETITAVDTKTHATATISFDVIRPSGLLFERVPGTAPEPDFYHHQGWPDIGFAAKVYLQPDTVSFEYISVRERDAFYSATGYYSWENGLSHDPSKEPESVTSLVLGKGWLLANDDSIWSGRKDGPAFIPGHETVVIPWEYTAEGNGEAGPFYYFAQVVQDCKFESDRSTLTASKGTANIALSISSPNYK